MSDRSKARLAALAVLVLTGVLATVACSGAGPEDPPPGAAPSATGGGCPPDAFKDTTGLYCVVVPAGYTSGGPAKTSDGIVTDQWADAQGNTFSVDYAAADRPGRTLQDVKDMFKATLSGTHVLASADLEGGGEYERFHDPRTNRYTMRSVVPIGGRVVRCQATYDTALTPNDACRTLRKQ
ncbi:hypothetical protein ACPPVO_14370 [Dactylosporangium sp. McL0621]|uniref:hypothetical protein n=1 Tax=Dactylosporangium sp. McL0621 TaxID=3415678 RepID=UPI003CE969BA